MSVSVFANVLRTHSRLRVLTATRVTIPATRSISTLVAFRTALPKNVSVSVSRSFTTSQVVRNELEDGASSAAPTDASSDTILARNELEDGTSSAAPTDAPSNTVLARNELEYDASSAEPEYASSNTISARNELEDGASKAAPTDVSSNTIFVGNIPWNATEVHLVKAFTVFGQVTSVRLHMRQNGILRGTGHIDFASKDDVVAALKSAAIEPIRVLGRDLRVYLYLGDNRKPPAPHDRLYFSGYAGDESEIRTIFQQFSDSIVGIHQLNDPRTGSRSQSGFIRFNSTEAATKALEVLNGTQTPDGGHLALSYARVMRSHSGPRLYFTRNRRRS